MKGAIYLTDAEAHEAVRAYLVLRGTLPAHGKVTSVKGETGKDVGGNSWSRTNESSVTVGVEVGDAPAPVEVGAPNIDTAVAS